MLKMKNTLIRPLSMDDLDNLMSWVNDPEIVGRYAYFTSAFTREEEIGWLQTKIDSDVDFFYAIENEDGIYLGNIALEKIHWPSKHGDLSITIANKKQRGKGHGYRAIQLILKVAFEELKLHKVCLLVAEDNEVGIHIYKKCGFEIEGKLRDHYVIDGTYVNMFFMSVFNNL